MKPLFTIHAGEFLVGDYINRRLGKKFDVWVPTKDSGVDLLVTRKDRKGGAVGLKFSRSFGIDEAMTQHLIATSWFTLDPAGIRKSQADLWVLVILNLRHEGHYIVIPTEELRKRIPPACKGKWNLYLWVLKNGFSYQVRDLPKEEKLDILHCGVKDKHRDFSQWLENWDLLDKLTRKAR
jgi:hypothetical protein